MTDGTRTNTTALAADNELVYALDANSIYAIEGSFFVKADAGCGAAVSLTGPSLTGGGRIINSWIAITGATAGITAQRTFDVYDTSSVVWIQSGAATVSGAFWLKATIKTASASGNLSLVWANRTQNFNTATLYAGSWMSFLKL
jgi:hypothetical protein